MTGLSHSEIVNLLISISTLLLFGRVFGELMKKVNQPPVVGELIAGILLGPTVLGTLSPATFTTLFPAKGGAALAIDGFVKMAVILLLFIGGLEVELHVILKQRRSAVLTSLGGIFLPFSVGFAGAYLFPKLFLTGASSTNPLLFALFIGTALSISALPVIVRTLMDLKIFKSPVGMLILSSAMIDDIVGWLIFSVIMGAIGQTITPLKIGISLMSTLLTAVLILTVGKWMFNKILPWINKNFSWPGGILTVSIAACFISAALTEYIGIHAIFGAFLVGVAIGDSVHMSDKAKEVIYLFVTNIFAPLFFVSIGLKVNFLQHFDIGLVIIILCLAYVGKVLGAYLAALLGGFTHRDSLAVGFGLNARGAMEIILALQALQAGIIREPLFVALVIMALVTSITAGPLMRWILKLPKLDSKAA